MSFLDNMEALSVKVPVSGSMLPVSGPGGDALETSVDAQSLLSSSAGGAVGFGVDTGDVSFHPLLGQDSLMSERDSQTDPDTSDTPHSFELCSPRGPSDCTSSSFDIVFEDSGCDRDAEADTDSASGPASPGILIEKNSSSSSHTRQQESIPPSSSSCSPPRPTSLTLALPTTPPTQRVQQSPKVSHSFTESDALTVVTIFFHLAEVYFGPFSLLPVVLSGVPVHPDAALSEREPEGLDGSPLPPRAEGAQPVSGHLPPDCRGCRFPAQQGAHAQGPQGEHTLYTVHCTCKSDCTLAVS